MSVNPKPQAWPVIQSGLKKALTLGLERPLLVPEGHAIEPMSKILHLVPLQVRIFGFCFGLMLLCSCATQDSIRPVLPAETSFNGGAGRGDYLFITLHLRNGEGLLFAVDTGAPLTTFDKSLAAKLGKPRGNVAASSPWYGVKVDMDVVRAPALYLGNTRLLTGDVSLVSDLSWVWPGRRVMGILGLDCLHHYCIQLDFGAKKMRFFDPRQLAAGDLGRAFPLTMSEGPDWRVRVGENLVGMKAGITMIDTGNPGDGSLEPNLFKQELQNQKEIKTRRYKTWTGRSGIFAMVPKGVFGGETYTNLALAQSPGEADIGLRFLARNLVTFDFPKRTMYLKPTRVSSLDPAAFEAIMFLSNLKADGQLPGWIKDADDQLLLATPDEVDSETFPLSRTFNAPKNIGPSRYHIYHYTVVQAWKDSPWKLQRAWQTDTLGRVIEGDLVPGF